MGPKESTHPRGGSSICVRVCASVPTTCRSRCAGPGVRIGCADPDARILARGSGVRIQGVGPSGLIGGAAPDVLILAHGSGVQVTV